MTGNHVQRDGRSPWRDFWVYLVFVVIASVAITKLADWHERPAGSLGLLVGLSLGAAYLLGIRAGKADR